MYFFLQKLISKKKRKLSIPFTDIHAHLLPGIDDGPKDIETALALLERLHQLGYKQLIATPHVYWDYYPNTTQTILDSFQSLKVAIEQANIPISLDVAAEYFLDDHFEKLIKTKDLLTLGNTKYVLVECSTLIESMKTSEYLFLMQAQGYKPILAHAERYLYYTDEAYGRFLRRGCKFQVNLLSFAGHYGKAVQKRAMSFLKKDWVHFLGTDAHRIEHVEVIEQFLQTSFGRRLLKRTSILNNSLINS